MRVIGVYRVVAYAPSLAGFAPIFEARRTAAYAGSPPFRSGDDHSNSARISRLFFNLVSMAAG